LINCGDRKAGLKVIAAFQMHSFRSSRRCAKIWLF